MRLLYIADGRSEIALNWIAYFVEAGHEVHLLSTFQCAPELELASLTFVPVAFSSAASRPTGMRGRQPARSLGGRAVDFGRFLLGRGAGRVQRRMRLRHWFGPVTLFSAAARARRIIEEVRPELVHALRVPFEGMLAAQANPEAPLLLSVWGNDFTLHAPSSPCMALFTRRALRRADGLHTDCQRDLRLARRWGYPPGRPETVLPGNGGIRKELLLPGTTESALKDSALSYLFRLLGQQAQVIVNPRGLRAYVRNDTFFRAIPEILARNPRAAFLCPGMAGMPEVEGWLRRVGLKRGVHLLPRLSPAEMMALFQRAAVSVSPSEHDGTPNTLLEAMAGGAFPVAGDLPSIREWIEHGVNGFLIDPGDHMDLALAVSQALDDDGLRSRASVHNRNLVEDRASYEKVMGQAESLYGSLAGMK